MKPKNRSAFPSQLCVALGVISTLGSVSAANIYWDGAGGSWSTVGAWSTASGAVTPDPSAAPGSSDIAIFNQSGSPAGVAVLLNGNQSALGIQFNNTSSMSLKATAANQVLLLGASGLTYGTGQVDLGGTGTGATVISLTASQSWTGSGSGLIQLLNGAAAQGITNGTSGAVTLTFAGVGTGSKTISAIIDNGSLGGTTALTINTTGSFGTVSLNGNNTYSGGTTLTQGFLGINNALALGGAAGALTINGSAQTASILRSISTSVVGGVTLTNNNAQNWNSDFSLSGGQSINFGTGAVALGANTTIYLNPSQTAAGTSLTNYTEGGNISGAFGLTVTSNTPALSGYSPAINAQLTLNGTNTYTGGTTITSGLVKFGSTAAIPTGANKVVLNGGAISVSGAYSTLADVLADTQITKTSGALALTADSSENFTAPNTNISVGAALGSTVKYTGTITTSANNYNLGGGGGTIVFTNTNAFTGAKSITTNGGPANNIQGGGGTVIIAGINNATGGGTNLGVSIGQGTLQVDSIGSLNGAATNLGQFTTAANGTINFGASGNWSLLRYTGSGETTDRTLNWAGFSGGNAGFDASGTGTLTFSTTTFNQAAAATKNLTLRGINTGANTIVAGIGTSGTNNGTNALTKAQRGNWTLSGSNNVSGLTINGGTLTADYTNVATVFTTSTPNLTLNGGALSIKGNVAGTTTQTLGNLTTSGNAGQNQITVTGNGSANTANLTLGSSVTRGGNTYVNFNLLNGGTVTTSPTLTNGLIATGFTVTDSSGTDFATITGGKVAKLGAPGGALPTSVGSATVNYSLSGNVTLSAGVAANTVKIDTSSAGGTLTLSTFNVTGGTGEFLMTGANDYTISGTALRAANASVGLSNYGAGRLTISTLATSGTGGLNKTGPGLVDLAVAQTYTGATNILGGVLRVSSTIGTGNISLNTGGIYEIATATPFNRTVGTGTSQVQWGNGDGGFSAFGGNRTVALANALGVTTGQMVWGSTNGNNFVTAPNASPNFVKDGFALLLSSSTATGTLDFQNPIDFVNMPRTVEVGDGSASVDAVLSGVLSSSDYSGGLYKTGTGTLALTATNTYTGATNVNFGKLVINGNQSAATGAVTIASAATLGGSGSVGGATTIQSGGFLATGNSIGTQNFLSGLTIAGTDTVELGTAGATPAAGLSDRAVVTGNLVLTGGTLALVDNAGANAQGSAGAGAYRLATFTGSRTGTFATVTNPLSATLHEKVVYNGASNGSVDLELYALASAATVGTPVALGKARVGDSGFSTSLTVTNATLANSGFTEGLNATQGAVTGDAIAGGSNVSNLAGASSSTSLTVGLSTATSGAKSGTTAIGFASNGSNSGYADTALAGQTVAVSGAVYDYAAAAFALTVGDGTLTGSGLSYTLDFGSGLALSTNYTATIQLANTLLSGFQDALGGAYTATGDTEFSNTSSTFTGLAAGDTNSFTITFNTGTSGTFNGNLLFNGNSEQAGLSNAALGGINIAFTGIAIPEPSAAMVFGGLGVLALLRRRRNG